MIFICRLKEEIRQKEIARQEKGRLFNMQRQEKLEQKKQEQQQQLNQQQDQIKESIIVSSTHSKKSITMDILEQAEKLELQSKE